MIENKIRELYDIFKVMKSGVNDVVVIYHHYIIFVGYDGTKMTTICLEEDTGIEMECMYLDIDRLCNNKEESGPFRYNYDMPLFYRTLDLFNKYSSVDNTTPLATVTDFQKIYPDLVKMKVDEHYRILDINGLSVMMIPGIISLAKPDIANLYIYKGFLDNTFILRFDVFRKKIKSTISIYLVQFKIF
jgi:hypothetical protein